MSISSGLARLLAGVSDCFHYDLSASGDGGGAAPSRSSVEPLEPRRLMTSVTGSVTSDGNPLEGWSVWADSYNPSPNGHYDTGEPCAATDGYGCYHLTLGQGCFDIHLDVQSGYQQTTPVDPSYYHVSSDDGDQGGMDFTVSGGSQSAMFASSTSGASASDVGTADTTDAATSAGLTAGSAVGSAASQLVDAAAGGAAATDPLSLGSAHTIGAARPDDHPAL